MLTGPASTLHPLFVPRLPCGSDTVGLNLIYGNQVWGVPEGFEPRDNVETLERVYVQAAKVPMAATDVWLMCVRACVRMCVCALASAPHLLHLLNNHCLTALLRRLGPCDVLARQHPNAAGVDARRGLVPRKGLPP